MNKKVERNNHAIEIEVIQELVDAAISKAISSMEMMLKIRVKPEHVRFGRGPLDQISEFDNLGRFKVHLVKVAFKGDIGGAFYFIINGHEVDLINRVCLPEQISSDTRSESKMMSHGFMSEIENMIAAQSINEISEFLGVQLIGEVPEVHIMRGSEVNDFLDNENDANHTAFFVRSVLSGVVVNVAPYFVWMLDQTFLNKLKENIVY